MRKKTDLKLKQDKNISQGKNISLLVMLVALGVQTMIVELAIPRLIAPIFGNTLFCWTAIIAIVLIALSIGYYLGGRLSAHKNAKNLILIFGAISSFWVAGLSFLGEKIISALSIFDMMFGPLIAALLFAALPTGIGAAVVPLVIGMWHEGTAKSAGKCYAWSTIGSIIGVLITGYFLLPYLGISGAMLVGSAMVFVAILINGQLLLGLSGIFIILILGFASLYSDKGALFDKSNGYHRIRIVEDFSDKDIRRIIYLDSTAEGAVELGNPSPIVDYQKKVLQIAQTTPKLSNALFLGGGAFSMPKYIKHVYPDSAVDVVEIDPDVIDAAHRFLEVGNQVNIFIGDGRRVLRKHTVTYDLIVNDAFHGVRNIPFHMVTQEFNRLIKTRLSDKGIYAVNVMGHPVHSRLVNSVLRTMIEDFEYVSLFHEKQEAEQNIWILASREPLHLGYSPYKNEIDGHLLTDNKAPVEFLIALDLLHLSGTR